MTRSISLPAKPVKSVPSATTKPLANSLPVLGSISLPGGIPLPVSNDVNYEDDPCVICHDEMTKITKNVSLDCGHSFHHDVSITCYSPFQKYSFFQSEHLP